MNDLQETVIQNIKRYFEYKKIKRKDFCEATGYSQGTLSQFMRRVTTLPRIDLIKAFMAYDPKLNIRWLLFNEGEMLLDDKLIVYKNSEEKVEDSMLVESLRKMVDHLMEENKRLRGDGKN